MDISEFRRRLFNAKRELLAFNIIVFLMSCIFLVVSFLLYVKQEEIIQLFISLVWVLLLLLYLILSRTKMKVRYSKYSKQKDRRKIRKLLFKEILITISLLSLMPILFLVRSDSIIWTHPFGIFYGVFILELIFILVLLFELASSGVLSISWLRD
jgi:L-asparagine transporter-like permease